jgi:AcrR family transcriptional regulator
MTDPLMHAPPERGDTRARLLRAAGSLFSQHGVDEVTMAEIAQVAGVARATVFNHFPSKHALVEAITEEVLSVYRDMLDQALADDATPVPALLRELFAEMGRGIEFDRRFFRGVFREIAKLQLGLDEGGPGQRANEANHERLLRIMRRGQARGELSGAFAPEVLATAFTSLVNGTITHWLYDDATDPLAPRMVAAADVLLGPVELPPGKTGAPPRTGRGRRPRLLRSQPAAALAFLEEDHRDLRR